MEYLPLTPKGEPQPRLTSQSALWARAQETQGARIEWVKQRLACSQMKLTRPSRRRRIRAHALGAAACSVVAGRRSLWWGARMRRRGG